MSASNLSTAVSIEDKALELLGMGFEAAQVASALNVSAGRISQLVSDESFTKRLGELKYKNLIKHNETDNILDKIEKKLADKLEQTLPLMMRPTEIANVLARVNGMKRRGASSPEAVTRTRPVVKLQIPIAIIQKFQLNAAGQVISAGVGTESQDLVTIQSGLMNGLVEKHGVKHGPAEVERWANGESSRAVLPSRLREPQLSEADGVRYIKPQGRACTDILDDCGFSVEMEITAPPEGG